MNVFRALSKIDIGACLVMSYEIRVVRFLTSDRIWQLLQTLYCHVTNFKNDISTENISLENIYMIKVLKLICLKFYSDSYNRHICLKCQ